MGKTKTKRQTTLLKSEFWVTFITSVSGLLLAFGVVTDTQAHALSTYVPNIIGAFMALISALKFVSTQHAARVEVFRAMCAASLDKDGAFTAQSVETPEDRIGRLADAAGL